MEQQINPEHHKGTESRARAVYSINISFYNQT